MKRPVFRPQTPAAAFPQRITPTDLLLLLEELKSVRCAQCGRSGIEHHDADHLLVDPLNLLN